MESPVLSLYVHVPFCARKCSYCAFYSEASNTATVERYVSALVQELNLLPSRFRPRTVFFGGGTPSLLTAQQWQRVLKCMEHRGFLGAEEFTIECNPATVSLEKARVLRDFGVNRVSLGVQSFNERLLDRLGRIHSKEKAIQSFDLLRRAGFDNINLDLMFAIPGQTMEEWRQTLAQAIALQSDHLASYEVIYEEDTPLFLELQAGKVHEDEDMACAMYEELVSCTRDAGFVQYEVANFARGSQMPEANDVVPYRACKHNVNYWRGGQFYGLGPSATAYVRGVRSKNVSNTIRYCELVEQGRAPVDSSEELGPLARAGEIAAFGLRMTSGWPFQEFQSVTGHDLRNEWADEMRSLQEQGFGEISPARFRLTDRGLRFADTAAQMFLR